MKSLVHILRWILLALCFVSSASHAGWIENGVPLTQRAGTSEGKAIAPDGYAGAIIAYGVCHDGYQHIAVQRVASHGVILWGGGGVEICTAIGDRSFVAIVSDGAGGAIVTWADQRSGNKDIYAQRVNASGEVQWTVDGLALSAATGSQSTPAIVSDGAGGAIVAWTDARSGTGDIYAQQVNASGEVQWTTDGVALCAATGNQYTPVIVSDDAGGAVVAWTDARSGTGDIYVQKINAAGAVQWATDGVALCTTAGHQDGSGITSDGAGGAIVIWEYQTEWGSNLYAQRVDASGAVQWTAAGVEVYGNSLNSVIISDGAGGAIVAWNSIGAGAIYAQRVTASGALAWSYYAAICEASESQCSSPEIVSDGAGVVVVTWTDWRTGNDGLYAQKVNATGAVQWTANGIAVNNVKAEGAGQVVFDGAGGAIVAWSDTRYGKSKVYAQRLNVSGAPQWAADGVALCAAPGSQRSPQVVSDGAGGAIVAWRDYSWGEYPYIYAQRVSASGVVQWTAGGVSIPPRHWGAFTHRIVSDGAGGAIIAWMDSLSLVSDISAQRVTASGTKAWGGSGVAICTAGAHQTNPAITSDGSGGAVIAWKDYRNGNWDIYAQRVSETGAAQWAVNGVAVSTAAEAEYPPVIASDGVGGAIVAWERNDAGRFGVRIQRMDASGSVLWTANGIALAIATTTPTYAIISDGMGGAIVVWGGWNLYAQWVDASGVVRWAADGVGLCTAQGYQEYPTMVSDGAGGAIVTWQDGRDGSPPWDLYAQRVDTSGAVRWAADGLAVCTATGNQSYPQVTPDGAGGAILAWQDDRCGPAVYAQRVRASGEIVSTLLQGYAAVPAAGGGIRINWILSEMDGETRFSVLRASLPEWSFALLEGAAIEREGLSFTCVDESCLPGSTYKYRVACGSERGSSVLFETDAITIPALPVTLYQNHPNPFNPRTVIHFYLPEAQEIILDVYNVAGERVARLAEGKRKKGYHTVTWDGRSGSGSICSSGVYFSRLVAGKSTMSRKMVIMR